MSLLHIAGGATEDKLDSSDVFSTYLYTGNGSTQTINNGIDLAGKGGMVWIKSRSTTYANVLTDTIRGLGQQLTSNGTVSENYEATAINAWNSNGFSMGGKTDVNANGVLFSSWTFREATKFFHQVLKVHSQGTASTVDLSTLGTVGMVTVKSTINWDNWFTWHRSLTAGNNLKLNLTDAQSTTNAYLSVSGTTLTIAGTAPSDTYIIYAWAHDTSADGIIQCGSFTTDASGNATVNLGWEPQFLKLKTSSTTGNWMMFDSIRGMPVGSSDSMLLANLSNAESLANDAVSINATGFTSTGYLAASQTYIYMAIRRPNKVPTSGSEVYNSSISSGVIASGFTVDAHLGATRSGLSTNHRFHSRLQGGTKELVTSSTIIESTVTDLKFDVINGLGFSFGSNEINNFFKRAKGFMDIVCYTGTEVARTVNHNLGVVPELMIVKKRSGTVGTGVSNWCVYQSKVPNSPPTYPVEKTGMFLDSNIASFATENLWNTKPTESSFYVSTASAVNESTAAFITYLFASCPNVSKVGSYTGNGTSQTINCGFSTGARFILIKRTDSTGDWYIWDTARGIVAANDPHLSLNTTAAEVTTDDSIDPEASGFIVNQVAATNVNVNLATYIYFSVS